MAKGSMLIWRESKRVKSKHMVIPFLRVNQQFIPDLRWGVERLSSALKYFEIVIVDAAVFVVVVVVVAIMLLRMTTNYRSRPD